MSLSPCRTCKKEVADDAKLCPHCGTSEPSESLRAVARRYGSIIVWLLLIAFVLFMVKAWLGSGGVTKENVAKLTRGMTVAQADKLLGKGIDLKNADDPQLTPAERATANGLVMNLAKSHGTTAAIIGKLRLWRGTSQANGNYPYVVVISVADSVMWIGHTDGPWE